MSKAGKSPVLMMNIKDMIDLSIGSPECGVVDLNMLHAVLHCLAQQIRIRFKPVQLRGDIALTPVGDISRVKTVNIDEYLIETEEQEEEAPNESILVVERIRKLSEAKAKKRPVIPKQEANSLIRQEETDQYKLETAGHLKFIIPKEEDKEVTYSKTTIENQPAPDVKKRFKMPTNTTQSKKKAEPPVLKKPEREKYIEDKTPAEVVTEEKTLEKSPENLTEIYVDKKQTVGKTKQTKLTPKVEKKISNTEETAPEKTIEKFLEKSIEKTTEKTTQKAIEDTTEKNTEKNLPEMITSEKSESSDEKMFIDSFDKPKTIIKLSAETMENDVTDFEKHSDSKTKVLEQPIKENDRNVPSEPKKNHPDSSKNKSEEIIRSDRKETSHEIIPKDNTKTSEEFVLKDRKKNEKSSGSKTSERTLDIENIESSGTKIPEETARVEKGRIVLQKSGEKLSLVTDSRFKVLENVVKDIQDRVYGGMSGNDKLIQQVRSQANLKSITDMWTSLNVSTRLQAAEQAIQKLGSLLQDLIGESGRQMNELKVGLKDTKKAIEESKLALQDSKKDLMIGGSAASQKLSLMPPGENADLKTIQDVVMDLRREVDKMAQDFYGGDESLTDFITQAGGEETEFPWTAEPPPDMETKSDSSRSSTSSTHSSSTSTSLASGDEKTERPTKATDDKVTRSTRKKASRPVDASKTYPGATVESITAQGPTVTSVTILGDVTTSVTASGKVTTDGSPPETVTSDAASSKAITRPLKSADAISSGGISTSMASISKLAIKPGSLLHKIFIRFNDLDRRIRHCCTSLDKDKGQINDQLINLQEQSEYLLKQITLMSATKDTGASGMPPDIMNDLRDLTELFQTVKGMQEQLKQVHDTAIMLASEQESRQQNMNAMMEQIEFLKAIKLDRVDMEEAMAEKADVGAIARKVSFNDFELVCDDLSKGLEIALRKLAKQDSLWQRTLNDIQNEIQNKLDKVELKPLKEFFTTKMYQLQEHLKKIAASRRDILAAGTQRRLLKDVNCISCDAEAVMGMEPIDLPTAPPLPSSMSMKPYLSYELDAIRKATQCHLPQRNMHDWEQIERQMTRPRQVRSETDKHLCNRYCGGSHTRTTPAQRVTRTGHFIKQWGPDVVPLSQGMAAGDDGRMYKISIRESVTVGPAGAAVAKGRAVPPEKPMKRQLGPSGNSAEGSRTPPYFNKCSCLSTNSNS